MGVTKIISFFIFAVFENYQNSDNPDSKVHGANMGPIWDQQEPGGPHVGPMSFATIWLQRHLSHINVIP